MMSTTKNRLFLPALLTFVCLLTFNGCGTASSPPAGTADASKNRPDSVRISIVLQTPDAKTQVLMLTNSALALQLYATTFALPLMPEQIVCTQEAGPHYTLTFLHSHTTVATALAWREGCRPVSITGEKRDRQATSAFWAQLDQAIYEATPAAIAPSARHS